MGECLAEALAWELGCGLAEEQVAAWDSTTDPGGWDVRAAIEGLIDVPPRDRDGVTGP